MAIDITLPQLLRRNAATMGSRQAMREKERGIWQPYTWRQYWEETREFAAGLAAAGFKAGDKLAVIGENRPHLYFAQLAAMCLGGVAVPVADPRGGGDTHPAHDPRHPARSAPPAFTTLPRASGSPSVCSARNDTPAWEHRPSSRSTAPGRH